MSGYRLPAGGAIERDRPLSFRFDGRRCSGYAGDTLASALLAEGIIQVGRSFKYHRPRGIYSAGPEEPNALVTLGADERTEPNTRATQIELYDNLEARSQNRWPSLRLDLMALNGLLSPLFVAGFYYKTFMWPARFWEPVYERFIRKAAGLGRAGREPDPDVYDRHHAFCDVLVVGAGPAGLAAARSAAEAGADVLLVDERAWAGGQLAYEHETAAGRPARDWIDDRVRELQGRDNVRLRLRTTAFGLYDGNVVGLIERVADHQAPAPGQPRQRYWIVRPAQVVLATGAIERPLSFAGNDRPGIMLAAAARGYANRFAVAPGRRVVVAAGHDDAYRTALDLRRAGIDVPALADSRPQPPLVLAEAVRDAGVEVLAGHAVTATQGQAALRAVTLAPVRGRTHRRIDCDALVHGGGWMPSLHLHSHRGARPAYDDRLGAFVPGDLPQGVRSAGACEGLHATEACIAAGARAGAAAAAACDHPAEPGPTVVDTLPERAPLTPGQDLRTDARGKCFVDLQHDVTVFDVALAHREGYRSVEHLKRYTTLGMATDQGKTANLPGLALMARLQDRTPPEVGTTTFRPPYTPVTLGALAGRDTGRRLRPVRRTPLHDWHEEHAARMLESGLWLRPQAYPRQHETIEQAARREATHVREAAGIVDVSTLGKLEVVGPDAAELLDRLYVNPLLKLAVGRVRYAVMLRDDGLVLDDGTIARLTEDRFFVTTTTAHAGAILDHIEYLLQTAWPELRARVAEVTERWAAMAIAGPRSRAVLSALVDGVDFAPEAFPFAALREGRVEGMRVLRVSFSGENAYEVYAPADYGEAIWGLALERGREAGLAPYGTEAMNKLRIEKGHIAGPELDGRCTLDDLGLGRMAKQTRPYVGSVLRQREGLRDPQRPTLVGLRPVDPQARPRAGALLRTEASAGATDPSCEGHVSSATWSPAVGGYIALGFLAGGPSRHGQRIRAWSPVHGSEVEVEVTAPDFVDPEGARIHA